VKHNVKLEQERSYWKKKIQEFQDSGLSPTEFAKQNDVAIHKFYYWRTKFTKKNNIVKSPSAPPMNSSKSLIPVISKLSSPNKKLPDAKWLAELIKALHEIS
jgi:hypothetical protein